MIKFNFIIRYVYSTNSTDLPISPYYFEHYSPGNGSRNTSIFISLGEWFR
jgi:hypothetical protein